MSPSNVPSVFSASSTPTPGPRQHHERLWQFLERSTGPVAADTRSRWDAWLSRMPAASRSALVNRLKDRHDEAQVGSNHRPLACKSLGLDGVRFPRNVGLLAR
jgi:hypothetical protein